MLPVLAGFIAMSIGDRPALAVGFVGGMMAANGKSGFLGALAAGFLAGLIILLLKKVFAKLPDALEKITPAYALPRMWYSADGNHYDVCHRAAGRSVEYSIKYSLDQHGCFE